VERFYILNLSGGGEGWEVGLRRGMFALFFGLGEGKGECVRKPALSEVSGEREDGRGSGKKKFWKKRWSSQNHLNQSRVGRLIDFFRKKKMQNQAFRKLGFVT
jgi:hypothetical protein